MSNLRDRLQNLRSPPGAFVPSPSVGGDVRASAGVAGSLGAKSEDYEYDYREVEIPQGSDPVLVYTSFRPWDAFDVYLTRPRGLVMTPNTKISVAVYAIVGGVRVLASSGRLIQRGSSLVVDQGTPQHVAAAREPGVTYEAWLSYDNLVNPGLAVGVACVGSKSTREPAFSLGQIPIGSYESFPQADKASTVNGVGNVPALLTGVAATNKGAAAGYVLVLPSTVAVGGDSPVLVFALGAGQSLLVKGDLLSGRRLPGITIAASSTPDVYTPLTGSIFVNGWLK